VTAAVRAARADDAIAMLGAWKPAKAELGGQAMPDAVLKTIVTKLTEGAYEATVAGQVDKSTWTSDAVITPKSLTVTGTEGQNKDKTSLAISKLKGDELKVCDNLRGSERPKEFKSPAGTRIYLVTDKRSKG
jgi:uncharacterized protein (TIGR03067 family)